MSQLLTIHYWKDINHLITIWLYAFAAIPFIFINYQFIAKKTEESVFKRTAKSSFFLNLIFVPATLFILHVLAKIAENTSSLGF